MKIAFDILLLLHGIIHILGFLHAFEVPGIPQLRYPITKVSGILWLLNSAMFIATAAFHYLQFDYWPIAAIAACALSQILIAGTWKDSKYGTIVNLLILVVALRTILA